MNFLLFPLLVLTLFFLGHLACRILCFQSKDPFESILINITIGMVFLAQCIALLGFLGLFNSIVFYIIVFSVLSYGAKSIPASKSFYKILLYKKSVYERSPLERLSLLSLFFLLSLSFLQALIPNFTTDALVYHLAAPKAFLTAGQFISLPDNVYSFFPLPFEMLYLLGLGLGGETLAQLISWLSLALMAYALFVHCNKHSAPQYSFFAASLFVSVPTVFQYGASTYVDIASALFVFMTFYAWENWRTHKSNCRLALFCIYAGFAVAIKLTCFIILPLVFLAIVYENKQSNNLNRLSLQLLLFFLTTLFIFLPWWAKNFYFAEGNPFVPFLMEYLGGEAGINWDLVRSSLKNQYYSMIGMGIHWIDFLKLPYNLTFHAEPNSVRFDGSIGIVYFLCTPALMGLRKKHLPLLGIILTMTLLWFVNFQFVRFLVPVLGLLALLFAQTLQTLNTEKRRGAKKGIKISTAILSGTLGLGLLYNVLLDFGYWKNIHPVPYLMGNESREEFLLRKIPQYPAYNAANEHLGPNDNVLLVFMKNYGYLMNKTFKSDSFFESYTLQSFLKKDSSVKGLSRQLKSAHITHILFDKRYVFGNDSAFSINEIHALQKFLHEKAKPIYGKNNHYLYHFMLD